MAEIDWTLFVPFWVACGIVAGMIAAAKAKEGGGFAVGFLLGVLLGPLGIILAIFVSPSKRIQMKDHRECPHCREKMRRDAAVCPHCQRESQPWRSYEGRWWTKGEDGDYWLDERRNQWVKME